VPGTAGRRTGTWPARQEENKKEDGKRSRTEEGCSKKESGKEEDQKENQEEGREKACKKEAG
jgi:hypothetical protein